MYIPKFFQIEELVPPDVFEEMGDSAFRLLDERALLTLDQIRDAFGVCIVNDWASGGKYSESGLRTPDCETYSPTSQHTFGRAMDCKFRDCDAETVRESVIQNKFQFPWITFIEDEVGWFHFDVRNGERIQLWSPSKNITRMV